MRPATLPILIAVICLALMVFYFIPGIYHPLTSGNPLARHMKHVILFAGLAVLSLVWARFATNSAGRR